MPTRTVLLAGLLVVATGLSAASAAELTTDNDKALYAMGVMMSRSLTSLGLSTEELELVKSGLTDAVLGKEVAVELEAEAPRIQSFVQGRLGEIAAKEEEASEDFLEKAAAESGAEKTESGLIYKEITAGTGKQPAATDTVKVHYQGTLTDGTVFDSSIERGEPATFPLNRVIPCWTQGVQKMKVGGKSQLTCPADLAYGDRGSPPKIKPGATLVFEVELLGIEEQAAGAQ